MEENQFFLDISQVKSTLDIKYSGHPKEELPAFHRRLAFLNKVLSTVMTKRKGDMNWINKSN